MFTAAVDAFANTVGLARQLDKTNGATHSHVYGDGAGRAVQCIVHEDGGAGSAVGTLARAAVAVVAIVALEGATDTGDDPDGDGVPSGGRSRVEGMFKRLSRKGQPVYGLGLPATWRAGKDSVSTLAVLKGRRLLEVSMQSAETPAAQQQWLFAFANAALAVV